MDERRGSVAEAREREIRRLAALVLYLGELEVQDARRAGDGRRAARAKVIIEAGEALAARLVAAGVQVHIKVPA